MSPPRLVQPPKEAPKGRLNRVMQILEAMTDEERLELFEEVELTFCTGCGAELPDEDSKEPDHDCPNADDDDEDGEGGEDDDDEDDEEDLDEIEGDPDDQDE